MIPRERSGEGADAEDWFYKMMPSSRRFDTKGPAASFPHHPFAKDLFS